VRFPKSVYANDAKEKLIAIQNHLAAKELAVGRYYQKNEDYIAAMNRFQTALTNWPESNQIPEAYYRLAVCYKALGMTKQMGQVRKKLKEKFPESVWTKRADKI
jgi:outer membrane protein assembly factor BamD